MAKNRKTAPRQKQKVNESGFNLDKIIPQKYHSAAALAAIVIFFLIFFAPMYFSGKTFQSGDIVTSMSYTTFVETYGTPLWNPYIFGGFPSTATISIFRWFDFIAVLYSTVQKAFTFFFSVQYASYTFHLLVLAFTSFFLMRTLKAGAWVSMLVSIATSFSTGIVVFLFIGHVSKLPALAMLPFILLLLIRFQSKIRWLEVLLLVVALHLMVITLHVQIIFYILFAVGIYFLFYIIRTLVKKERELNLRILKSLGIFAASAVIAVLMSFDEISQIYEYTPYSTRGSESVIEKTTGVTEESGSAFYDYHTNWSFSPGEVLTFIVPSYYGFGNVIYKGPLSQEQEVEVQTYFGQMPFVDVPMYMGAVIFFFALYGIYARRKDPFVQFLTLLAGISLLISFGKTLPVLFDLMFYNFPFFNKFRVPSMILVLVQISLPLLAGLGIMQILEAGKNKEIKSTNLLRNISLVFGGLFVLSLLLSSPVKGWLISHIHNSGDRGGRLIQMQLGDFMSSMFHTDLLFAMGLTALAFGAAYFYISGRLTSHAMIIAIAVLVVIDLWRIDSRAANYIEAPVVEGAFNTPGWVIAIKSKNEKTPFRILNMKQDGTPGSLNQNQNYHAYFLLEDLYGYSGIKPRAYQDIIDVLGSPVNVTLWRMLNTRYIITDKVFSYPGFNEIYNDGKSFVYENSGALPRAYFVNSVEKMDAMGILNAIKTNSFDPGQVVFTDEAIKTDIPDSTTYVEINGYAPELISMDVNASGNNFLFLGSTYYPTGWKAEIDGKAEKIYRANHGYMGIVVPAGKHKVEFIYHPDNYYLGKYIALILSSVTLAGILLIMVINFSRKKS